MRVEVGTSEDTTERGALEMVAVETVAEAAGARAVGVAWLG